MKMLSHLLQGEGTPNRVKEVVRENEIDRRRHEVEGNGRGRREAGVAPRDEARALAMAATVKADLHRRYRNGESPAVAEYLDRYPELRDYNDRMVSLIYEEFCLRKDANEDVGIESFCDRYPEWKKAVASQLKCHLLINEAAGLKSLINKAAESRPTTPEFPNPGESFGEFDLISILGTGGSSRVFLARDSSLGGREVVLKVAVDQGNEPTILGRLIHPRIVWINSVSYHPTKPLRGLSMPYHPGLPLDEILKRLRTSRPRDARAFWDVLVAGPVGTSNDGAVPASPPIRELPGGDGWSGFPFHGTYAQGVAWIGQVLAETLDYAHGQRIFHRDIKPGNVLMTRRGGPLLLDFNMAESAQVPERAQDVLHGGTPPYMAPEQIRAFLNPALSTRGDASSDVYSLGLVLRELLTGRLPDLPDMALPLRLALSDLLELRARAHLGIRDENPDVPHALEAIVSRCLAFNPEERYTSAADLAADLKNFLRLQPLRFARNPSIRERVENWLGCRQRIVELGIATTIGVATLLNPLSLEDLPSFREAVRAFRGHRYAYAIGPLKGLADAHPNSPVPSLLLALARNTPGCDFAQVEDAFRRGMSVPGAHEIVQKWATDNPSVNLPSGLDKFADSCFSGCSLDSATTEWSNRLLNDSEQAIRLSLRIDPGRRQTMLRLATLEESRKNYPAAYDLVSDRIAEFRGRKQGPIDYRLDVYPSLLLSHCRIGLLWAEQIRAEKKLESVPKFRELLIKGLSDLDECDRLGIHDKEAKFKAKYMRVKALSALIELNCELSRFDEAQDRLNQWPEAVKRLREFNDRTIPGLDKMLARIRVLKKQIQLALKAQRQDKLSSNLPSQ